MKFLIKIGFFSLLFSSCSGFFDQVIDIDPPKYEPKMVINCVQSGFDFEARISVTRNVGLLENIVDSTNNLKNATVEWLEDGVLKYTFTRDTVDDSPFNQGLDFQYYGAVLQDYLVIPGKKYEIRVSQPDYPSVSATQIAPIPVILESAKVKLDTNSANGFLTGEAIFTITFQDPPNESNFYQIGIENEDGNTVYFNTDDPNIESGIEYDKILLADRNFEGKKYTIRLKSEDIYSASYKITFTSLTKEYYLFSKAVPKNQDAAFNPFASPVQIPSNIVGGLGIFGLKAAYEVVVNP
jgi:Domain of unknown function (DUF4249)